MNRKRMHATNPALRATNLPTRINFKKQTIMIIDDDEILAKNIYQVLLEREGYRVLTAKDGVSGLALLKKETRLPDLIFVDCWMPQMDGEAFLLELKNTLPNIFSESKVIGFTSSDPQSPSFLKIKSLAFDCREKPFSIEGMLEIVSDYIVMPSDYAQTGTLSNQRTLKVV